MSTFLVILLAVNKTRILIIFLAVFGLIGIILGTGFLFKYCRIRLKDMSKSPEFLESAKSAENSKEEDEKPLST